MVKVKKIDWEDINVKLAIVYSLLLIVALLAIIAYKLVVS